MPAVTYDDQSLMIEGRRVWLVSGTIEYSQVPRGQWRQCIRAAKEAGLNCIATRVPWSHHEPKQGKFSFSDELDLRHFVELIGQEGMFCILRPGPYVDGGFENGGLPAWLGAVPEMKLREASRPFLDACARWFRAVMAQVQDLQVTSERNGTTMPAPILLVQIEHAWFCDNGDQARRYLGELVRFLREEGCPLPLIETNNCWQSVEGAFATWMGSSDLAAHMRQFRVVQQSPPAQHFPLMVSEFRPDNRETQEQSYQLAQALAVGAQVNIEPLCAGRFWGCQPDAPVDAAGRRNTAFTHIKRLATFANQFGHLFAHLYPDQPHAAPAPQGDDHALSIMHRQGSQGDVIFLLRSPRDRTAEVNVLVPDGQTLPVPLGDDRAAWVALNVNLGGVSTLTYSNLRPWAFVDRRLLVLFGPAGARGIVSIDGTPIDLAVPKAGAAMPVVHTIDSITVVVLNEDQVDASWVTAEGVVVGAGGFDGEGNAVSLRGFKQVVLIKADGVAQKVNAKPQAVVKTAPRLGAWSTAKVTALLDGTSETFKEVTPGSGLDALDPATDYGWYRLSFRNGKLSTNLLAPGWGGRMQVFVGGKASASIEHGEAFSAKPARDWVVLADNHGRPATGWQVGALRGLSGHLFQVKPVKLGKPAVVHGRTPDPSKWRAFLPDVSYHHSPPAGAWSWTLKPMGRLGLIVRIDGLSHRVLVMVGDSVVGGYDPESGSATIFLEVGRQITGGRNTIKLALFHNDDTAAKLDPRKFVTVYDAMTNLTAKAEWSFAPWAVPDDDAFEAKAAPPRGQPCWFRATFDAGAAPLWLDLKGMSTGQVLLNGRSVGRYGALARSGDGDPMVMLLPSSWLAPGGKNVLTIFDEQGRPPRAVRLRQQG